MCFWLRVCSERKRDDGKQEATYNIEMVKKKGKTKERELVDGRIKTISRP